MDVYGVHYLDKPCGAKKVADARDVANTRF